MAHRAKLALAGEIDFLSGLHHETYRERAKGEKRLTYLAQAQNNWDAGRATEGQRGSGLERPKDHLSWESALRRGQPAGGIGNLRPGKPEEIHVEAIEDSSGKFLQFVDRLTSGEAVAALVDMPLTFTALKGTEDRRSTRSTGDPQYNSFSDDGLHQTKRKTVVAFIKGFIEALHFFKTQPEKVVPDTQEKPGKALRPRGRRVLYPPPARVGAAVVKKSLSARKRDSKRLRPRCRQRSRDEKHRTDGAMGPALSPCHR